jgi:hypothetical protein
METNEHAHILWAYIYSMKSLFITRAGPAVLQRVADQFRGANFTVAPLQDIGCRYLA